MPQIVATHFGWDYEQLRHNVATNRAAQERWTKVEAIVRGFAKLRVESEALSVDALRQIDASLAKLHVTLQPLWKHLGELLGNMQRECELPALVHALAGGYTAPSPGKRRGAQPGGGADRAQYPRSGSVSGAECGGGAGR